MTATVDKYKINNKTLDKRIKLTDKDKEEIKKLYPSLSLRQIAKKYNVSTRAIQFVLYPERLIQARKNSNWKNFYNKDKHRLAMQRYREHKKELLEKGLLK